jgi:hypothetical protein
MQRPGALPRVFFFPRKVERTLMARIRITRKDGTATPYFWVDRDSDRKHLTVYKRTPDGIKRMKGVTFDAVQNRFNKD